MRTVKIGGKRVVHAIGVSEMWYNVEVNAVLATKAERIKNTLRETKERRRTQRVFVYELKLQNLSKRKVALLERAFLEAKWLYNWLLSDIERLNMPVHKVKTARIGRAFTERGSYCRRVGVTDVCV